MRRVKKQYPPQAGSTRGIFFVRSFINTIMMDGWMDRWMDGRMDGWMDKWMDGRMDGWMDGPTDGHILIDLNEPQLTVIDLY